MPSTPKEKTKKQSNPTQIRPASITTTTTDEDIQDVREWGSALSTPTKSVLKEKSEVPQSPKRIKKELRYRKTSGTTWDVQFSNNGKYVFYNDAVEVVVLDLEKGEEVLRKWTGSDYSMGACTPDSKSVVVLNGQNEVRLYDIATGTMTKRVEIVKLFGEKKWLSCPQISPHDSNLLISGSGTGKFIVYDMEKKCNKWDVNVPMIDTGSDIRAIAISNNINPPMIALSGDNKYVTVVDEMNGTLYAHFFPGKKGYKTTALAFSPDDKLLAIGDWGGYLTVISTEANRVKWAIQYRIYLNASLNDADFSSDGKWLACAANRSCVVLVDVATGAILRTIKDPKGGNAMSLSLSPDCQYIAVGYGDPANGFAIYDLVPSSSTLIQEAPESTEENEMLTVHQCTLSPCGRWVLVRIGKRNIYIYKISSVDEYTSKTVVFEKEMASDFDKNSNFSYDGNMVGISTDTGMHLVKLNTNDETWPKEPNKVFGNHYSFAIFGKQSNICFYGLVAYQYVHDLDNDKQKLALRETQVNDAIFTHQDTRLVVINILYQLKVYNLDKDSSHATVLCNLFTVNIVDTSPINSNIIIGCENTTYTFCTFNLETKEFQKTKIPFTSMAAVIANPDTVVLYKHRYNMEIAATPYHKSTHTLDASSSHRMAGLFGGALSRPDCDSVRSISYCKKTKLVGV
eukprot:g8596.t1